MTLYYMLADKAFALEVEQVVRELRIMRSTTLIEEVRAAKVCTTAPTLAGHGGSGAAALANTVQEHERHLAEGGRTWNKGTAHDLAVMLTNNGRYFRLVSEHVICTKGQSESGLCTAKRGEPDTGNCKTRCSHRIEEKAGRRDTEELIEALMSRAERALAENELLALEAYVHQLDQELERYEDLGAKFSAERLATLRSAISHDYPA